jgi:alkaline phosphatase D
MLPPILYTLFAIYIPSFISSFLTQAQYDILGDEVDITITDVEVEDQPPTLPSAAAHSPNLQSREKPTHIEEVQVKETLVVQERSPKLLRTLLTGLPSPTSALLSLITLLINVGLVLAATDFIYRGKVLYPCDDLSFARVGYVSDTEAKLLVREPDQSKYPIFISMKTNELDGWQSMGGINFSSNETDYTTVFNIPLRASDLRRPWEQKGYHWVTRYIAWNKRQLSRTKLTRPFQ